MPIPESTLPGHRQLHNRVVAALGLLQESQSVDFKRSTAWAQLQFIIVKSVLAMGNLRDGGIVVIGVAEDGGNWQVAGISEEHLATYDTDDIIARVNQYVSPYAELDIVRVTHSGVQFLAIQAREFRDLPLVCKRNGPADSGLAEGAVFVRTPDFPQTTRITSANQMRDLLELAAEKRARLILQQSERLRPREEAVDQQFDQELGGL